MAGKNPVVHFEMPYQDRQRLTGFYAQAFGWRMDNLGEEMGYYIMAVTAETDENGMVKTPGTINGGFYPASADPQGQCPSVVIAVTDLKQAMEQVTAAGGKVLDEPMEIPGVGQFVSIADTEGNRVGMLQPMSDTYRPWDAS